MDCSHRDIFNALTYPTRSSHELTEEVLYDEIKRFVGTLEYNREENFQGACLTARSLIIQEACIDTANGNQNLPLGQWENIALSAIKKIQQEGSDLEQFMRAENEPAAEKRFSVYRILEDYESELAPAA